MHTVSVQQTVRETFQCRCPHLRGCNAGTHCSNRPAVCRWEGSVSVVGDEQGVFVVGICDDERAERVLFKQKSFDDKRIKLCPAAFHDDVPGGFVVEGGFVYPLGDQRVIDVGEGHEPPHAGDFLSLQAAGISFPVPALMVGPADVVAKAVVLFVLPFVDALQQFASLEGVRLHDLEFLLPTKMLELPGC